VKIKDLDLTLKEALKGSVIYEYPTLQVKFS